MARTAAAGCRAPAAAGCTGTPAGKFVVSGEITYDGEPVSEGHIAARRPWTGSLVPEGAFFTGGKYTLLAGPGEKPAGSWPAESARPPFPAYG